MHSRGGCSRKCSQERYRRRSNVEKSRKSGRKHASTDKCARYRSQWSRLEDLFSAKFATCPIREHGISRCIKSESTSTVVQLRRWTLERGDQVQPRESQNAQPSGLRFRPLRWWHAGRLNGASGSLLAFLAGRC